MSVLKKIINSTAALGMLGNVAMADTVDANDRESQILQGNAIVAFETAVEKNYTAQQWIKICSTSPNEGAGNPGPMDLSEIIASNARLARHNAKCDEDSLLHPRPATLDRLCGYGEPPSSPFDNNSYRKNAREADICDSVGNKFRGYESMVTALKDNGVAEDKIGDMTDEQYVAVVASQLKNSLAAEIAHEEDVKAGKIRPLFFSVTKKHGGAPNAGPDTGPIDPPERPENLKYCGSCPTFGTTGNPPSADATGPGPRF